MFNKMKRFSDIDSLVEHTLQKDFPDLFKIFDPGFITKGSYPRLDVVEESNSVKIIAEIPGVLKEDIEIFYENNYLCIKGNKSVKPLNYTENTKFLKREIKSSSFLRGIYIDPSEYDVTSIKAKHNDIYLEITIPKYSIVTKSITIE